MSVMPQCRHRPTLMFFNTTCGSYNVALSAACTVYVYNHIVARDDTSYGVFRRVGRVSLVGGGGGGGLITKIN